MSDEIDDSGPAFPVAEDHETASLFSWTQGLSIRDYFAAAALTGLVGDPSNSEYRESTMANFAYAYADAMLEARKPKP